MEGHKTRADIIEVIDARLVTLNLGDFESQNQRMKEYLYNIEIKIQEANQKREEFISDYKKLKLSIKSVADYSGISRQTIYNNRAVLEAYIADAVREQEKYDIFNSIKVLGEKKQQLEEVIFKMQVRDLKIEKLQNKIDEQENVMIRKDKEIDSLQVRNGELNSKLTDLERNIKNNKILQFNNK